jgi:ABC-2 type transport system ATP-binding protein
MSAAVEAQGISRRYGSLVAVSELTFAVEPGEILGVLGPNGAGKTTAIRVLTTILAPSAGRFAITGIPHARATEIRRQIGVLPESAGYPERLTAQEFVRYFARLHGHGRASARAVAETLLEEVGLAERRDSSIASYSRGMRQRLGIARALVNDPRVVFLDEPTLGLDPAGQRQILGTVRDIAAERGVAVLLSTHLLAEVEETCSRVLILNRGRVAAEGTVAEVVRRAQAPRSGRIRVPSESVSKATAACIEVPGVERVEALSGQAGWLTVTLSRNGRTGEEVMNESLRAVIDAGVPVLFFELEGARLSDAFLAMTEVGA